MTGWKGLLAVLIILLSGCTTIAPRNAVPVADLGAAQIEGIPDARFWGDQVSPWLEIEMNTLTREEIKTKFPALFGQPHNYLAISGGGANGAFGAGLLTGWTQAGTRPEFQMVTGISTGALIAPFAFLGPDYDHVLEEVYTTISTSDILIERSMLSLLSADAVSDTLPLQKLLKKYVNDELVSAIAAESRRGRVLYIGTTDLDYMRPVIWDIGAIAVSGRPGAAALIRKILLASSSIPGAMPPVWFEVTANGKIYDELHGDGGTATQVFVYPSSTNWTRVLEKLEVPGKSTTYVIRNSALKPTRIVLEPKLGKIAGRSISSLIRTQGIGDLYLIYMLMNRDNIGFHLAYIPDEFEGQSTEPFDREYMNELYGLGHQLAIQGYHWLEKPPGLKIKGN